MTALYPKYPRFRAATEGPEDGWDLFDAALWLAEGEESEPDVEACDAKVQAITDEMRRRGIGPEDGEGAVRALATFLFSELGYEGDTEGYYELRNCFVHEVLRTRKGIPITLTVLFMEVARRMGFQVHGVGFPGHFLARWDGPDGPIFLDPFRGGRVLSTEDQTDLLKQNLGDRVRLRPEFQAAASKRQVIVRLLRNVQNAHTRARRYPLALSAIERILSLSPADETAQHAKRQIESILTDKSR